jgi:hypothetical protein
MQPGVSLPCPKEPDTGPVLSQTNLVHIVALSLINIILIILRSLKLSYSLRSLTTNFYAFLICIMFLPLNPLQLDQRCMCRGYKFWRYLLCGIIFIFLLLQSWTNKFHEFLISCKQLYQLEAPSIVMSDHTHRVCETLYVPGHVFR